MPLCDAQHQALRTTAAATRLPHVLAYRFGGTGAADLLDVLTSSRLFIRENQMLSTLMLDEAGRPWADVIVAQDEDSLMVLVEGPTPSEFETHVERVRQARCAAADVRVIDLLQDHVLLGLDGPFAWEITSAVVGPAILGAPYLSFLRIGDIVCFRSGKTGEFGYTLLVPRSQAEERWSQLFTVGTPQGLIEGSTAALEQCALENWHFSMRVMADADPALALTPLELQLQWRVDYEKDFMGAAAVRARRAAPLGRATCFVSFHEVRARDRVTRSGQDIGSVLAAGWSPLRKEWVGWALLAHAWAWPRIDLNVLGAEGPVPIETRSPPLLNNRSLHVDPHRHSYQTRGTDVFPPLVLR